MSPENTSIQKSLFFSFRNDENHVFKPEKWKWPSEIQALSFISKILARESRALFCLYTIASLRANAWLHE